MKILFTSLLVLLIFSGCTNEKTDKEVQENVQTIKNKDNTQILKPTIKANDQITLTDTSGQKIKVKELEDGFIFEGYENKVVLLNFFATWCPPCKAEIPHLNNLQKKYKDDIKIISILLEGGKPNEEIIKFIQKHNIEFTITNSPDNFKISKKVGGVQSIPFMLIYDRQGHYSQHYKGAIHEEMIEADIKKVI